MTVLTPKFVASFLGVSIKRVSCGARFTAAVTTEGEVWTWGKANVDNSVVEDTRKNDTTAGSTKVAFKR